MSGATIAPTVPAMERAFADTPGVAFLVQLVLVLPAAAIVIGAPIAGVLADRFSKRRLLLVAMLAYILAGSAGLWLDALPAILVSRGMLGLAVACIMTCTLALAGDFYHGLERDRYVTRQAAWMSLGGVVFIAMGGLLAGISWRGPFGVYLLPILLWPFAAAHLRARADDAPPLPRPGTSAGPSPGETDPPRLNRASVAAILGTGLLLMFLFFVIPSRLPYRLQSTGGLDDAAAGLLLAGGILCHAAAAFTFGRFRHRVRVRAALAGGFAGMACGYALIAAADGLAGMVVGLVVSGLGTGVLMPATQGWLLATATPTTRGRLSGALSASLFLGQVSSPLVSTPLLPVIGGTGPLFAWHAAAAATAAIAYAIAAWHEKAVDAPAAPADPIAPESASVMDRD